VTRDQFDAIWRRASAELTRSATASAADIGSLLTAKDLTSAEARRLLRAARNGAAPLYAALDQYDAAKWDVPPDWLPPGEETS